MSGVSPMRNGVECVVRLSRAVWRESEGASSTNFGSAGVFLWLDTSAVMLLGRLVLLTGLPGAVARRAGSQLLCCRYAGFGLDRYGAKGGRSTWTRVVALV